uniref:RING-type domain-containing protein n=1 Tax=Psilocybe cubensis TaxID=181762 RepID=A0A8H7Y1X7_PSICU
MEHENLSPLQWGSMIDGVRRFLASINDLVPAGQLSTQQVTQLIDALPNLTEPRLVELGEKGKRPLTNPKSLHDANLTSFYPYTAPHLHCTPATDSSCPICMTPYLAILAEEETAHAMDSPAHPVEELGVTKLDRPWQCGHIFCRRE